MRARVVVALVCFMLAGAVQATMQSASSPAAASESWVRYRLPGTQSDLTTRWQLVGVDGPTLRMKVETFINGELRSTREMKATRLEVPAEHRRETVVIGGRSYACKVFEQRGITYWYSEDVPLLGIVRSREGARDVMELVEASAPRAR